MRRAVALGGLFVGTALAAGVASAHALDARAFTAPLPLPLLYAGAGVTVAVTAGWVGLGDGSRVPMAGRSVGGVPSSVAGPVRHFASGGALLVFAAALAHGVLGPSAPAENLATVVIWPLGLKGIALWAVLAGSPWRTISPWETLYDLLVAVEGDRLAVLGSYPDRLGAWPAVAGFVAVVGILENLTLATRSPHLTVAVAGGYAALMLAGSVAFGREWFARADALAVLFGLLGRVSVLRVERTAEGDTEVRLRPPWTGCVDPVAGTSVAVFVVATVYTVSFDGVTATAAFRDLRFAAQGAVGLGVAGVGLYLAGLLAFVACYLGAAALAARLAGTADLDRRGATLAFAGTVVPIAAAYEVAHNYPYVAGNLGRAVALGRDLLVGTDGGALSLLEWLPVAGFWASQVALVVVGHVVGVVAAHRVASAHTGTAPDARRTHAPFVVVMVGYTVLSLWIVSQPLAG